MNVKSTADAERYARAAHFYCTGRPPYPRELIRQVAAHVSLRRAGRVLDLGTGPGCLAIAFSAFSDFCIGIDPCAEMLDEARQNAVRADARVTFLSGSSFSLSDELGVFQLVTMGRMFHWTDRAGTLRRLDALVEAGGAIAIFGTRNCGEPMPWQRTFEELLDGYCGEDRARASAVAEGLDDETLLRSSSFSRLTRLSAKESRRITLDSLIARALSRGSLWSARPNLRQEDLMQEVSCNMKPYADEDGGFGEEIEGLALVAMRDIATNEVSRSSPSA